MRKSLESLNPYSRIVVEEALRREIAVEVLDEVVGHFRLTRGARSVVCWESLSELTSAIAMARCDDKGVTLRLLERAGIRVPEQTPAGSDEHNRAFLARCGRIVVKPLRGEQGAGVSVHIETDAEMAEAIEDARAVDREVLLEQHVDGDDLRVIVIDGEVVAAAVRREPHVVGNGKDTIRTLIEERSRERELATEGVSHIALDHETERCVQEEGHTLEDVLPNGVDVRVRDTYNVHQGATIHDVTGQLHPSIVEVARRAAVAIDIPVVGLDFLMPDIHGEEYVIIEANERPGLANHEPQPTAQRFMDLLFPGSERR